MSEINKEWVQNVGLELADSSNCPLYACTQCPNGTIHCDECFAIFMKEHDAKIRTEAIDMAIRLVDTYPAIMDIDRRTEEAHLVFAVLADIVSKLNLIKEQKNE